MGKNPYKKSPFPGLEDVKNLSKKEAGKKAKLLREAIEFHDYKYYIENNPVISDEKYDHLFDYLLKLEKEFPDVRSKSSPTSKIGAAPLDELKKKKHPAPMQSLDSSTEPKKIKDFIHFVTEKLGEDNTDFTLEPKFDGLSVEVAYENGNFSYAATRGDGETGDDISENARTISSLPLTLREKSDYPDFLSLRGEIFMNKEGFQKLNKAKVEKNQEPFANARNAASGIVRQLDPQKVSGSPLDIFFYEILSSDDGEFENHRKIYEYFRKWGLKTNNENENAGNFNDIKSFYEKLGKKREELPYEIDGVVIKLNNRKLRKKLGSRQRSPRWAYAWKFEPRKEITTIRHITIQVGRTGILTPVALLDPVDISGVTVSRATLHNENEVREKDVRPGDTVRVIRAGDVIPEIAERVKKSGKQRQKAFEMPKKCPVCHSPLKREGAYTVCPAGLSCKAQVKGNLSHYASRKAMDIEHLGEKVIGKMVEKDLIKNFPDLYKLKPGDIEEIEGFAGKSAKKLHESIQGSKSTDLYRFLYALGIRHVGIHIARVLAGHVKSFDAIQDASVSELSGIDEVGQETAESIYNFLNNKQNKKMLEELFREGIELHAQSVSGSGILDGKTLVFTGELNEFTRDEAQEKVESLGGHAASSVSSNTDYVVVGDDPGKKLEEARKNKVKTINEEEFKDLIS